MGYHFSEVQNLVRTDKNSNTIAKHYTKHIYSDTLSARDVPKICKFKILQEGKTINVTQYFGTRNWTLCLQEKLHIVHKGMNHTDKEFLNKRSEIEGLCRHKILFRRLQEGSDSTVATGEHTIVCKKFFL